MRCAERSVTALAAAALLGACGGAAAGDAGAETSRVPERAGTVWVVDTAGGREAAPAALLAYVHGLHVLVLDDDDAYAGMTRLRGTREADGAHLFRLGAVEARLAPVGDAMELRFGSGEVVALRRQDAPPAGGAR